MNEVESTFCVGDVVELLFQYRIKNGSIYDDRALQRGIIIWVDDAWEAYDVMWTDGTVSRNMFLDETTTECIVRAKGTSRSSSACRTLRPLVTAANWILCVSGSRN
jgi:hypothetical protein